MALACYIPTIAIYYHDTQEIYEENSTRLKSLAIEMSRDTLSFALASGDKKSMKKILDGITENPIVYSATLYSDDGAPLTISKNDMFDSIESLTLSNLSVDITTESSFEDIIQEDDDVILNSDHSLLDSDLSDEPNTKLEGKLELQITSYMHDKEFFARVVKSTAISLGIWIIMLFFIIKFTSIFIKRLNNFLNASAKLAQGEFDLRLDTRSPVAEVSNFAKHYNILAEEIRKSSLEKAMIAKKTEEANAFKQQFLQMAAHQIRTPISSIISLLDLTLAILGDKTDPLIKRNLNFSAACADELEQQLVTIMNLSAIEDGTLQPVKTWFRQTEPVDSADRIFMTKCNQKAIKWYSNAIDVNPDIDIFTDKNIVKEIVKILADNAVKYTDEGFVRFNCYLEENTLRIQVEDSGIGIAEDDIEVLMINPRQLDQSTSRTKEGWGFGMMLLHKYVALLDGKLSITSNYQEGSTFEVMIPVETRACEIDTDLAEKVALVSSASKQQPKLESVSTKKHISPPTPETKKKDSTSAFATSLPLKKAEVHSIGKNDKINYSIESSPLPAHDHKLKVLVIEDDDIVRIVVKDILEMKFMDPYKVEVDTVPSAKEALIKCREKEYDILFVDYHMPDIDGYDFITKLKRTKTLCGDSKLIAMTADTSLAGQSHQKLEDITDRLLIKPLDKVEIKKILESSWLKVV